jgi:AraC family transcriptional regulator of adaptative response/methylated-DNA-[protein]-cysteine methyltransferase
LRPDNDAADDTDGLSLTDAQSPFGRCLVGMLTTSDGSGRYALISLSFLEEDQLHWMRDFRIKHPEASSPENDIKAQEVVDAILAGQQVPCFASEGTEFDKLVWSTLRKQVPWGTTVSYKQLAELIGRPTASRAVANSVAKNEISLAIPCHRVITSSGDIGKYRWGRHRKEAILKWEQSVKPSTP